jgi:hypothetical protein
MVHLIILNLFRNPGFRKFIGIPEYLPGTKLERLVSFENLIFVEHKVINGSNKAKDILSSTINKR